jgi:hypothetical protein
MGKKKGKQPAPHPDAELFALVEQYIVAEQKYCDLNAEVDDMEGMMHNTGRDRENNPLPGYKAAVRKKDKADTIEKRIANLRAKTIEGLYAKVRCALAYELRKAGPASGELDQVKR